jgi:hypothetical protein
MPALTELHGDAGGPPSPQGASQRARAASPSLGLLGQASPSRLGRAASPEPGRISPMPWALELPPHARAGAAAAAAAAAEEGGGGVAAQADEAGAAARPRRPPALCVTAVVCGREASFALTRLRVANPSGSGAAQRHSLSTAPPQTPAAATASAAAVARPASAGGPAGVWRSAALLGEVRSSLGGVREGGGDPKLAAARTRGLWRPAATAHLAEAVAVAPCASGVGLPSSSIGAAGGRPRTATGSYTPGWDPRSRGARSAAVVSAGPLGEEAVGLQHWTLSVPVGPAERVHAGDVEEAGDLTSRASADTGVAALSARGLWEGDGGSGGEDADGRRGSSAGGAPPRGAPPAGPPTYLRGTPAFSAVVLDVAGALGCPSLGDWLGSTLQKVPQLRRMCGAPLGRTASGAHGRSV